MSAQDARSENDWVAACPAEQVPSGARKLVKLHEVEVAVFNVGGSVFAIDNRCPHRGGPLIRGYPDTNGGIKCPMHGWRFDLRTGESPRPAQATVYRTKIENGLIYLAR